jgi:hypothetical protein
MYDHPGRFVDYEQMIIFEDNGKRQRLRRYCCRWRHGWCHRDHLTSANPEGCFGLLPCHLHKIILNPTLNRTPARCGQFGSNEYIEPLTIVAVLYTKRYGISQDPPGTSLSRVLG